MKEQCKDLLKQRDENLKKTPEFNEEIEKQFIDNVKELFSVELQKSLAVSPEDARMVLDNLDIKTYVAL